MYDISVHIGSKKNIKPVKHAEKYTSNRKEKHKHTYSMVLKMLSVDVKFDNLLAPLGYGLDQFKNF